ncbi:uncharacterized protein LOC111394309 [Olea europaea var. sylvestris]|uniref:uncharacterized protein LOC111394309 n=1 Tax=Olea europaea var. sylvestris TaxID=158386 RepID=UPI000C1CEAE7|nr:uncharacterized protein LOC111394309 [Olea europaea var. sylvestris]
MSEYNDLKTLILKENLRAHYIHCFAHQVQLTLVDVAQKHPKIETFFTMVHKLVNVVGGSAKRSDHFRENRKLKILKSLSGITNELSRALQRKDQDIVNAIRLMEICKAQLQTMRDDGWDSFFGLVCSLCETHNINVPDMNDMFITLDHSQRETVTNLHHFCVEIFYAVIDMQLRELNDRFSEVNSDFLLCVACLSPNNSFITFDKTKVMRLCQYYSVDFDAANIIELDNQLDTYILDMCTSEDLEGLQSISALAQKLVAKNKHEVYPLVYKLLTLALVLFVATVVVERAFSAMTYVKNRLHNRIGDQWVNDSLIAYIGKDVFDKIENDVPFSNSFRILTLATA